MGRGPGRAPSRQREVARGLALAWQPPEETRDGSLARERSTETHQEIVRLPAKKREVGQSQKPDSHMKWRFKNRKTFPGDRDQMAWGWVHGRRRGRGSEERRGRRRKQWERAEPVTVEPGWRAGAETCQESGGVRPQVSPSGPQKLRGKGELCTQKKG